MSTDDHDRISEIFLKACDLPPEEQKQFLDEACAGRPELRADVESILAHDERASAVLRQVTSSNMADAPAPTPEAATVWRGTDRAHECPTPEFCRPSTAS